MYNRATSMPDILSFDVRAGGSDQKPHLRNYLPAKIIILADLLPTH
jgi:hypothetical protein